MFQEMKEELVLLPGMMCDKRQWQPQIDALRDRCASITVADTTSADSIHEIAKNILSTAPETFALAGLSMGGLILFEMWRLAPERITRVALLDANASAESPEKRKTREDHVDRVIQGGLEDVIVNSLRKHYFAPRNQTNQQLLDLVLEMALDLGPDVFVRQSKAVGSRQESISTLKTINVPALVLCGKEDFICPVDFHELMATNIPKVRLVVLEDCGHLSTLDQPENVSAELVRWLGS